MHWVGVVGYCAGRFVSGMNDGGLDWSCLDEIRIYLINTLHDVFCAFLAVPFALHYRCPVILEPLPPSHSSRPPVSFRASAPP